MHADVRRTLTYQPPHVLQAGAPPKAAVPPPKKAAAAAPPPPKAAAPPPKAPAPKATPPPPVKPAAPAGERVLELDVFQRILAARMLLQLWHARMCVFMNAFMYTYVCIYVCMRVCVYAHAEVVNVFGTFHEASVPQRRLSVRMRSLRLSSGLKLLVYDMVVYEL
jgi:hypothetical protein